jgi:hypothetical protein
MLVRRTIDSAHDEGRRFRRRVQLPLLTCACVLVASCVLLMLVDAGRNFASWRFVCAVAVSGPALQLLVIACPSEAPRVQLLSLGVLACATLLCICLLLQCPALPPRCRR